MSLFISYLHLGKSIFPLFLILTFLTSGITFAQIGSISELKKDMQVLKEKQVGIEPGDPWTIDHVITTRELSEELSNVNSKNLVIYHIGFDFLYNKSHIIGSIYAGPASNQDGLAKIRDEVKKIKYDQNIVIYCGCCPWKHCPNIRPAYKTLINLGFKNVNVLFIPDTFEKDWEEKGYAVERKTLELVPVKKQ
jgi:thiosulfate/3-mercaptopyruvate sulfurtransferase